jgi:tight adherence protein C
VGLAVVVVALWALAMLIVLLVAQEVVLERHQVHRSLRSLQGSAPSAIPLRRRDLSRSFVERALVPAVASVGDFARRVTPLSAVGRIAKQLEYAGSPERWDAERVLATKIIAGVGLGLTGLALGAAARAPAARIVLLTLLLGATGYLLPSWLLRARADRRQKAIRKALPDTLDLLAISVEAGLGFDAAIGRVAAEASGPLAQELNRVLREMQLGQARAEALRDLAERSEVEELKSFVVALVQADVFGVSVAKVLQVQAQEMRTKRRQRAEEQGQKIPVKIVFPLILCIFPALMVVLLGPGAIAIWKALFAG